MHVVSHVHYTFFAKDLHKHCQSDKFSIKSLQQLWKEHAPIEVSLYNSGEIWVVLKNDQVVSAICKTQNYLYNLITHPCYRRQGWATCLIEKIKRTSNKLYLKPENSSCFYERLGFKSNGEYMVYTSKEKLLKTDSNQCIICICYDINAN